MKQTYRAATFAVMALAAASAPAGARQSPDALPAPTAAQPGMALQPYPETRQTTPAGTIITPGSSRSLPGDAGVRGHTNVHIFIPRGTGGEPPAAPEPRPAPAPVDPPHSPHEP